ncbi:holin family protein [Paracoccus sp. R12_1]|uniref:holin family protein n=1 Tax=unclassified Paracoccus (in: a-proteobacteria) TaxID=2688777 RepID=UPI001ADC795F|nr:MULTISPECIES: holin family protein [unclassified Paracoccus (in: a-proteobacteria)]MBO9454969.1 holin family protein [Paracoccus sp. R12_2]MBO9485343.1 holin family protein [Paracoccus sp. R12_1]
MGMIDRFLGFGQGVTALGSAATGMAEVFTQNATRKMELEEQAYARAITQLGQEFQVARPGFFDSLVNGLNRLPRPLLALGTMALFVYAMVEPSGFGLRMQGLQQVPEPLWWLLGAIVGFYFGAREAHYFRHRVWPAAQVAGTGPAPDRPQEAVALTGAARPDDDFADNAALRDWAAGLRE